MPLNITVFGATGHQGGAVARALAQDKDNFRVYGVTRDIHQEVKVDELKDSGVCVLECDLDNVDSIAMALNNSDACYIVTYTDFDEPGSIDTERQRGKNIADACEKVGVPHVIYSTQLHPKKINGIQVRHLEAKAEVEEYMRDVKKLPMTSFLVPCYYENFLDILQPRRVDCNNFVLEIPMGTTPLDLISVEDIGEIARIVFLNKPHYLGKTLSLCGTKLTIKEIAAEMSRHLCPLYFRDRPVTLCDYQGFGKPWSVDFGQMFHFFLKKNQQYHLEHSLAIYPHIQTFAKWLERNARKLSDTYSKI